jgi:hypothetical protein
MNVHNTKWKGQTFLYDDLWRVVTFNEMTITYEHICEHKTNHIFTIAQVFQSFKFRLDYQANFTFVYIGDLSKKIPNLIEIFKLF